MEAKAIEVGKEYGYRRRKAAGQAVERVRVVEVVRTRKGQRYRVEWLDGDDVGVTDLVESIEIVVPWAGRRALLREEEARLQLERAVAAVPQSASSTLAAIDAVLSATGEDLVLYRNILSAPEEVVARVAERAGIDPPSDPTAYTDRAGELHLPWTAALELAQAFARSEPGVILTMLDAVEREDRARAERGDSRFGLPLTYYAKVYAETAAAHALVRRWTGLDAEVERKEKEIQVLRQGARDAAWRLRRGSDPERVAAALLRMVEAGATHE